MRALVVAVVAVVLLSTGCAAAAQKAPAPPSKPVTIHLVVDGDGTRLPDRKKTTDYLVGPALLTLENLERVEAELDEAGWVVQLDYSADTGRRFAELTAANVNRQLAIVVDGVVVSAPLIVEPIAGESLQIGGNFTQAEAEELAGNIRGS
ncbi:SecDF P1 head subdomain-containing protein [Pseudonocardia sp. TRM90224]|uniref:SecDF P1 head subdomain-containing protein n=1 Tax=Pseudonocardia sp. TRM90224 TaxID=2812678 RepID=UPI001E3A7901|nr:hypothetical protein [Pseudonocardia sp. TRM90224]